MYSLGFCIWDLSTGRPNRIAGVKTEGKAPWQARANNCAMQVINSIFSLLNRSEANCMAVGGVIVETPSNWFTEKGQASKDVEAVQKLYYFCGNLIARFADEGLPVWSIRPEAWKGQTPKRLMVRRSLERFEKYGIEPAPGMTHDAHEAHLLAVHAAHRATIHPRWITLAEPYGNVYNPYRIPSTLTTSEEYL